MLQLYPVYLLCNRCKTLTGSPDPTCANSTNKPCMVSHSEAAAAAIDPIFTYSLKYLLLRPPLNHLGEMPQNILDFEDE